MTAPIDLFTSFLHLHGDADGDLEGGMTVPRPGGRRAGVDVVSVADGELRGGHLTDRAM